MSNPVKTYSAVVVDSTKDVTTLLCKVAEMALKRGEHVVFVSAELSMGELFKRIGITERNPTYGTVCLIPNPKDVGHLIADLRRTSHPDGTFHLIVDMPTSTDFDCRPSPGRLSTGERKPPFNFEVEQLNQACRDADVVTASVKRGV